MAFDSDSSFDPYKTDYNYNLIFHYGIPEQLIESFKDEEVPPYRFIDEAYPDGMTINEILDVIEEFSLQKYFISYFEAVMSPSGRLYLAVPSHDERMIRIILEKYHISRHALLDVLYPDAVLDLANANDYVYINYNHISGTPNRKQIHILKLLEYHGLVELGIYGKETKEMIRRLRLSRRNFYRERKYNTRKW